MKDERFYRFLRRLRIQQKILRRQLCILKMYVVKLITFDLNFPKFYVDVTKKIYDIPLFNSVQIKSILSSKTCFYFSDFIYCHLLQLV